jgi:hypothetical protein
MEYEYVEKILLKGKKSTYDKRYGIFVEIPIQDLMNKKLMKEVFGDRDKILTKINIFKECFYERYSEDFPNCNFYIVRLGYSIYSVLLIYKFTALAEYNLLIEYEIDDEEYVKIIKKIGEFYPWKDNEETLTDNMEKKQLSLFSILYNLTN